MLTLSGGRWIVTGRLYPVSLRWLVFCYHLQMKVDFVVN